MYKSVPRGPVTLNYSGLHVNVRKEEKRLTVQPITEYTLLVQMEAGLSIVICSWSASRTEHKTVMPCLTFERGAFVHIYKWNPFV